LHGGWEFSLAASPGWIQVWQERLVRAPQGEHLGQIRRQDLDRDTEPAAAQLAMGDRAGNSGSVLCRRARLAARVE